MTSNPYLSSENQSDHDDPPYREIQYGKNKFIMERLDPYGFWHVHLQRGTTPKELSGAYTTTSSCFTAIKNYLHKAGKDTDVEMKNPTEVRASQGLTEDA